VAVIRLLLVELIALHRAVDLDHETRRVGIVGAWEVVRRLVPPAPPGSEWIRQLRFRPERA
jgi:hypothetical protein